MLTQCLYPEPYLRIPSNPLFISLIPPRTVFGCGFRCSFLISVLPMNSSNRRPFEDFMSSFRRSKVRSRWILKHLSLYSALPGITVILFLFRWYHLPPYSILDADAVPLSSALPTNSYRIVVLPKIPCPTTGTVALYAEAFVYLQLYLRIPLILFSFHWNHIPPSSILYADAVHLSSALSAYFSNSRPLGDPMSRHKYSRTIWWRSVSILSSLCPQLPPMCSSYPLSILLIPSPTHLLCWILTLCVQYFLNLLLRAFLCLPQIPSFPAAAPYEAITITGTAPLADINIELLWLITNITASFGGGVNWR